MAGHIVIAKQSPTIHNDPSSNASEHRYVDRTCMPTLSSSLARQGPPLLYYVFNYEHLLKCT